MGSAEKELEDLLKDIGAKLASPPSAVEELLRLLDQTEIYLTRVDQSPSTSMYDALRPAMNSLITKELLNHPETDVKVFVAACINEITRITAPDAPYSDSLMKEIFAVIVDTFGKLDDISGPSYFKRVSILETVAKVRSCVVMLDLECDDLILQMFKHFLKNIRPDHSINVSSSMETIMTLVLEDSEDISHELLECLLSNVQKSKKDVIPCARELAEKVIGNCAVKLKPFILSASKSAGTLLSDYGDIVAFICQECSVTPKHNEVDEIKLFERTVSNELPQESEKLDKPGLEEFDKVSNIPIENDSPIGESNIAELKHDNLFDNVASKGEINNMGSIMVKSGNELDLNCVDGKSSVQLTDASDSSRAGDKEISPAVRRAGRKRKTLSVKPEATLKIVPDTEVLLKPSRVVERPPTEKPAGDISNIVLAMASENFPISGLSSMDQAVKSQLSSKRSTTPKISLSAGKKQKSRSTTMEAESSLDMVSQPKEVYCPIVHSNEKPLVDSSKSLEDDVNTVVTLKNEKNETSKKVAEANSTRKQRKSSVRKQNSKDDTEGDASAEHSFKEMVVEEANKDENNLGMFAETSYKKRHRKSSGWKIYIGRGIEVWWPDDQMFYKGVIDQFNPVTEKHKVVYDDGDVEWLLLKKEKWNYIDSDNIGKGQGNDKASPESSLQIPKKPRENSVNSDESLERRTKIYFPRGRPRNKPLKVATSPDKEMQATPGNDELKVEESVDTKPRPRSRGRPKLGTPKAATIQKPLETRGNEESKVEESHSGMSVVNSRGKHTPVSPNVATLPDEKTKMEESHDGKMTRRSRGRPKHEIPKVVSSPNEKITDAPNIEEPPQTNTPNVQKSNSMIRLPIRSRRRPKGENNEETTTKSSQAKFPSGDTPQVAATVKDDTLTAAKADENSRKSVGRSRRRARGRRSASRSRRKPKTVDISTQTDLSDDPLTTTPGSVIFVTPQAVRTNENHNINLTNASEDGSKTRAKRKGTEPSEGDKARAKRVEIIADGVSVANASAKEKEGVDDKPQPQRSAVKANKRRRR